MLSTLVLTKMLYGADSWTLATASDKAKLHAVIMRLYKRLICWKPDMNMCDEMIILQTGLPSPTELLRRARLRYLSVLLNCDMPLIWSLLNVDIEWKKMLEDDLNWMWMQLRHSSSLPEPKGHMGHWILFEDFLNVQCNVLVFLNHLTLMWQALVREKMRRSMDASLAA